MANSPTPDHGRDTARQEADPSSENAAADAGSESPEEGAAAMAAAEDATVDNDNG